MSIKCELVKEGYSQRKSIAEVQVFNAVSACTKATLKTKDEDNNKKLNSVLSDDTKAKIDVQLMSLFRQPAF